MIRIELNVPSDVFYGPTFVAEVREGTAMKITVRLIELKACDKEFAGETLLSLEPAQAERLGRVLVSEAKIMRRGGMRHGHV